MGDLTRKTLNFNERAVNGLTRLQEAYKYNETDTINRAIVLNAALLDYMEDGALTILSPDGERVRLVLI